MLNANKNSLCMQGVKMQNISACTHTHTNIGQAVFGLLSESEEREQLVQCCVCVCVLASQS